MTAPFLIAPSADDALDNGIARLNVLLDAGRAGPLQLSCAARGDRMVLRIAGAEPVAERVAPELRRLAGAGVVAVEIEGGALCLFYRAAS